VAVAVEGRVLKQQIDLAVAVAVQVQLCLQQYRPVFMADQSLLLLALVGLVVLHNQLIVQTEILACQVLRQLSEAPIRCSSQSLEIQVVVVQQLAGVAVSQQQSVTEKFIIPITHKTVLLVQVLVMLHRPQT